MTQLTFILSSVTYEFEMLLSRKIGYCQLARIPSQCLSDDRIACPGAPEPQIRIERSKLQDVSGSSGNVLSSTGAGLNSDLSRWAVLMHR
jgi:hypothetical protein